MTQSLRLKSHTCVVRIVHLTETVGTTSSGFECRSETVQLKKRVAIWAGILLGAGVVTIGVLQLGVAAAASPSGQAQCSLATVHGNYLFQAQGMQIGGPLAGPLAYAGQVTYDGRGHALKGVYSISYNGTIYRNQVFTGVYSLNADCTGSETDDLGGGSFAHFDLFVAPDGSIIAFAATDPGGVESLMRTRVAGGH